MEEAVQNNATMLYCILLGACDFEARRSGSA